MVIELLMDNVCILCRYQINKIGQCKCGENLTAKNAKKQLQKSKQREAVLLEAVENHLKRLEMLTEQKFICDHGDYCDLFQALEKYKELAKE